MFSNSIPSPIYESIYYSDHKVGASLLPSDCLDSRSTGIYWVDTFTSSWYRFDQGSCLAQPAVYQMPNHFTSLFGAIKGMES